MDDVDRRKARCFSALPHRFDDHVWVADWTTNRLVKYDFEGCYILDICELRGQIALLRTSPTNTAKYIVLTGVAFICP